MASGDRSNKIAISFKPERCLYSRSTWTACGLCTDSCPGNAIHSPAHNKPPSIDSYRCMQCGQCLSACPLEAFESSSFSERQLMQRLDPSRDIRLLCFLPQGTPAYTDSNISTYQLGTCLAALTPGALFELALSHTLELATDQCEQCSLYPQLKQTFESNVGLASLLLSDWGMSHHLTETQPLFLPENTESPVKKRRDKSENTFDGTSFMKSSIRSLFHGRSSKPTKRAQLPLRALKRRIPSWRLRLKELWARRNNTSEPTCPWPQLTVNESRCKACGVCMQLCPTGSIHQSLDDGIFIYSFTTGTCVNCGLCILSCASHSLAREYRPVSNPFEEAECSSRKARACTRCGLPVLESFANDRCFLCNSEPDSQLFVERVKKQMAQKAVRP